MHSVIITTQSTTVSEGWRICFGKGPNLMISLKGPSNAMKSSK